MKLKEVMERQVYKDAKYVRYVDEDGNPLEYNRWFSNVTVLHFVELCDGGLRIKLFVCNSLPNGWKIDALALTAPKGFLWINNGKSRFGGEYISALLRQ